MISITSTGLCVTGVVKNLLVMTVRMFDCLRSVKIQALIISNAHRLLLISRHWRLTSLLILT